MIPGLSTGSGSSAREMARQETVQLLNNIEDIDFTQIGLIIAISWLLIAAAKRGLPYLAERGPSKARLYLLSLVPIVRLLVMTLALLWIIPLIFNVTLENFFVIAGAASVAIGFAFKDYVSSLIAGVVALFERPYRAGDWITVGDDYGEIREVGLRSMELVTPDDDVITVPHSRLWTENISNANDGAATLQCVSHFFVASHDDAGAIRNALFDVALTSAYLDYRRPVIVVMADEPWGTHFKVRAYPFDMRDQFLFITDITARGRASVRAAGGVLVEGNAAVDAGGAVLKGA